jgi:hypothetical protein
LFCCSIFSSWSCPRSSALCPLTLCSMPYALCSLGWLRFCISEIPQTPNPSATRLKKENWKLNYLCYCFLNKNNQLFFFIIFLWSWKEINNGQQSIIDNYPVELSEKYLTF